MEQIEALAAYAHVRPRQIVWGDMDAMQHVNNTKYFYYCETARLEFLSAVLPEIGGDLPHETSLGIALAETGCRFKAPITYPDELLIGTAVSSIDDTEFSMRHALYSRKLGFIAAEATARVVYFDSQAGKRAPLSEQMVTKLEPYLLSAS